jgi:riboflavin synthase alpha subunit
MFTGIVEGLGTLVGVERRGQRTDLSVRLPEPLTRGVEVGASVALDGCCLTVAERRDHVLVFQAVPETLARTSLGDRVRGDEVNVERALAVGGRLDGHIVSGHVDGVGRIAEWVRGGDDVRVRIACPPELAALLVHKGSVAVDGVSLTVVQPEAGSFGVVLIPHTLAVTTLGRRRPGDRVNLEADILGKYVARYLEQRGIPGPSR